MTVAEIHGKISETGTNLSERMEDLLTSNVFGSLRYLPAETALLPFLRTARSVRGESLQLEAGFVRTHSAFWPWLSSPGRNPCEPDLMLGLETEDRRVHLLLVEAKYHAGLSSEEDERDEPTNQLAKELDNLSAVSPAVLGWNPELRVASRTLLFVTADMGMPRVDMQRALDEFVRKRKEQGDIFWTSWRFLSSILENALKTESDPGRVAVLEDMLALLLRKGLTMFRGIKPVEHRFHVEDFVFYRPVP